MADDDVVQLLASLLNGPRQRMKSRAERAVNLSRWAVQPPARKPGSCIVLDDDGLPEDLGPVVAGAGLFATMTAVDQLHMAGVVVGHQEQTRTLHTQSVMALCRAAMESATRAIWVMSPAERAERRRRAFGVLAKEHVEQGRFIEITETMHNDADMVLSPKDLADFQKSKKRFTKNQATVNGIDKRRVPEFRFMIVEVYDWLNQNHPSHDTEGLHRGLKSEGKRAYNIGSATTHGYRWLGDYVRSQNELLAMNADALAAALITTECAVALCEAQSCAPNEKPIIRPVITHLEPTITQWTGAYRI
ncbi:hypothetical protein [Nocardia xishanensis]